MPPSVGLPMISPPLKALACWSEGAAEVQWKCWRCEWRAEGWGLQKQLAVFPPAGVKAGRQTGHECPDSSYPYEGSGCSCVRQASAGSVWGWVHGAVLRTAGTLRVLRLPCAGKSVLKLQAGFGPGGSKLQIQTPLQVSEEAETEEETWTLDWTGSASPGTFAPCGETAESLAPPMDLPSEGRSSWPRLAGGWR